MALLIEIPSFIYEISSFIFRDLGVQLSSVSKLQSESESFLSAFCCLKIGYSTYEITLTLSVSMSLCFLHYLVAPTASDRNFSLASRFASSFSYLFYFAMQLNNTFLFES